MKERGLADHVKLQLKYMRMLSPLQDHILKPVGWCTNKCREDSFLKAMEKK